MDNIIYTITGRFLPLTQGRFLPLHLCLAFLLPITAKTADFAVTSPGFYYSINSQQPNPTLTLVRGQTYTFSVNTSAVHPFEILSDGVQNNSISSGIITYTVPMVASNYTYICPIHYFGGDILTIAPPSIRILGLSVSTNLVLRSTGTNGWNVLPQYSTDPSGANWYALTVITNRYLNGTNETICGRPPDGRVFIRVNATSP